MRRQRRAHGPHPSAPSARDDGDAAGATGWLHQQLLLTPTKSCSLICDTFRTPFVTKRTEKGSLQITRGTARRHGAPEMEPLKYLLLSLLAGAATAAPIVVNGVDGLRRALVPAGTPGPPLELLVAANISMDQAMAPSSLPARIARNVTLRGAGPPARTELSLEGWVNAWRLDPGVVVTLENLTLSNLALRPPDAPQPPPANISGAARGPRPQRQQRQRGCSQDEGLEPGAAAGQQPSPPLAV
jgi:hypothetical protein